MGKEIHRIIIKKNKKTGKFGLRITTDKHRVHIVDMHKQFQTGDILLAVDDIYVVDMSHDDIFDLISKKPACEITIARSKTCEKYQKIKKVSIPRQWTGGFGFGLGYVLGGKHFITNNDSNVKIDTTREVISVNDIYVADMDHDEVVNIIKESESPLVLGFA